MECSGVGGGLRWSGVGWEVECSGVGGGVRWSAVG